MTTIFGIIKKKVFGYFSVFLDCGCCSIAIHCCGHEIELLPTNYKIVKILNEPLGLALLGGESGSKV